MNEPSPTPAPAPAPAPAPQPDTSSEVGKTITLPRKDWEGMVVANRNLEQQNRSLQERVATVDVLTGQVNEWKAKASEAESRFTTFTEFSGALGSTDADVISLFDARYKALPEKDRPSRADWITGLKSKPDEAPSILRPFIGQAAPAAPQGGGKPTQPKVPGQPPTPPAASGSVTADQIRAARLKGQQTGDWTAYKALQKATGAGG